VDRRGRRAAVVAAYVHSHGEEYHDQKFHLGGKGTAWDCGNTDVDSYYHLQSFNTLFTSVALFSFQTERAPLSYLESLPAPPQWRLMPLQLMSPSLVAALRYATAHANGGAFY
jgi:hypothetical protein